MIFLYENITLISIHILICNKFFLFLGNLHTAFHANPFRKLQKANPSGSQLVELCVWGGGMPLTIFSQKGGRVEPFL